MADNDRNALAAMIEAVERGLPSPTNWRNFAVLPTIDRDNPMPILAHRAYYGDLNAAKALHEALTPYPDVDIEYRLFGGLCDVTIYDVPGGSVTATSTNPARAWLLAILRALAAEGA